MIFCKLKTKNNSLYVQMFTILQNHTTFHSEERLVNFVKGRECFVGLSILLIYGIHSPGSERECLTRFLSPLFYLSRLGLW